MADPANGAALKRCAACGFENPPATLYCQDCGAKLEIAPPSYLKTAAPALGSAAAAAETPPLPAKKPRIISTHRAPAPWLGYALSFLRLALYAALIACAVLFFRAPADLPPAADSIDAQTIGEIRAGLTDVARRGSVATAPWPRLNAYLASVLAPADSTGALASSFLRAMLLPRPGGFTLIVQKSLVGIPIYTTVRYSVVARSGRIDLEPIGGAIGRLPLPAAAAPLLQRIAGDFSAPLSFELGILRTARTVRLTPNGVQIDFGPARR